MRVAEAGGRLPPRFDPARGTGLGLQLVHAMARRVPGVLRAEGAPKPRFVLEFAAPRKEPPEDPRLGTQA